MRRRGNAGSRLALRRRDFLGTAAGAGAAAVVGADTAMSAPPAESISTWINGVVGRVLDERTAEVTLDGRARPTRVTLASGGVARKSGPVRLTDFSRGERVTAGGEWHGEHFHAEVFEELYAVFDGVVKRRTRGRLQTTEGPLRVTDSTTARGGFALGHALEERPVADIAAGDRVIAMVRYEPNAGEHDAVLIGVVVE